MVNTFLPFADFKSSAKVLDMKRLGKQRCEAHQILNVLINPEAKGWKNHPAVKMWKGYEDALRLYFNAMVTEWVNRGYNNNYQLLEISSKVKMPWWLGKEDFHRCHQSSLIRKNPEYYTDKFPDINPKYHKMGYVWPYSIIKVIRTNDNIKYERRLFLNYAPVSNNKKIKTS